jgi:hypothetical protein
MHPDITAAVGAAAFWLFVSVCVAAGAAQAIFRNREAQKTIRQAIDKGQTLDPALLERLMQGSRPASTGPQTRFGFIAGGVVMLCIGAGLAMLGWFISLGTSEPIYPLFGVGALVGMIGVGLLIAAGFAGRHAGADPR